MTKILYIPNGEYIKFYVLNDCEEPLMLSDIVEEYQKGRKDKFPIVDCFIKYLINENMTADGPWYRANRVKEGHKFLEIEFEVIYD